MKDYTAKELFEHIPQFTAFCLLLGTVYSVVFLNTYFNIYLHLPIFQLVDVSEIILYAPSQIISVLLLGGALFTYHILKEKYQLSRHTRYSLCIPLLIFAFGYNMLDFFNSELSIYHFKLNISLQNIPFFLLSVITSNDSTRRFIYNKASLPFIVLFFVMTTAFLNAFTKFDQLKSPANPKCVKLKLKDGKTIRSSSEDFFAGRTNKFCIIKDENVEISEFDNQFKNVNYLRLKEPDL